MSLYKPSTKQSKKFLPTANSRRYNIENKVWTNKLKSDSDAQDNVLTAELKSKLTIIVKDITLFAYITIQFGQVGFSTKHIHDICQHITELNY